MNFTKKFDVVALNIKLDCTEISSDTSFYEQDFGTDKIGIQVDEMLCIAILTYLIIPLKNKSKE